MFNFTKSVSLKLTCKFFSRNKESSDPATIINNCLKTTLNKVTFENCDLTNNDFRNDCILIGVIFKNCNLEGVHLILQE